MLQNPSRLPNSLFIIQISLLLSMIIASCTLLKPTKTSIFNPPLSVTDTQTLTPSFIPSITATPTPAFTSSPSPSSQPSATPVPASPTLTFPFTLYTPAPPALSNQAYHLVSWTPQKADDLIALLAKYPDLAEWYFLHHYDANYQAAAYTAGEALLRFPNDLRVDKWRFDQANNAAYGIYLVGGEYFSKLIVDYLNAGIIKPDSDSIVRWFTSYPTDLKIEIDNLSPLSGYKSSQVISIYLYGEGAMTFWLLEHNNRFIYYPLFDSLKVTFSTDYFHAIGDFTGDEIDDIMIYLGNHNGTFIGGDLVIYDLSVVPPRKLSFGPNPAWSVSSGFSTDIKPWPGLDGLDKVMVTANIDDPSCSFDFSNTFEWNGQWFDLVNVGILYWGEKQFSCIDIFKTYNTFSIFEQQALLTFYETTFGDVPPVGDRYTQYPPDAQDEFRYRLALQHAMIGQRYQAIEYLDKIINFPSAPNSQWISPAKEFENLYQTTADIYKVCQHVIIECNLQQAIEQSANLISNADHAIGIEKLKDFGLPILNYGVINLENDPIPENWFIIRNQKNELEFWLLAQSTSTLKAMLVTTINGLTPQVKVYTTWPQWWGDYSLYDTHQGTTYFSLNTPELFTFVRKLSNQEPFLSYLSSDDNYINPPSQLDQAIVDLLTGVDPEQMVTRLVNPRVHLEYESLSKYYYFLGLAYELSDRQQEAIAAYLQSWQNCCSFKMPPGGEIIQDPYAIMARAKLEPNQ